MIRKLALFSLLVAAFAAVATQTAAAQTKAPDYKITNIRILPFDSATGEFGEEFKTGSDRTFFNDLSISLLAVIEISGEAGSFEVGRKITVLVTEGKRNKATMNDQVGLIGDGGKFYVPVWLARPMCDEIKITAALAGQKTRSSMTRSVPFLCGE